MAESSHKRRKSSLKQEKEPPLYRNSELNPNLLHRRRGHNHVSTQLYPERVSPDVRGTRVRFSTGGLLTCPWKGEYGSLHSHCTATAHSHCTVTTSPSERITPATYYDSSPDASISSPGRSPSPTKPPSILKKPSFSLKLEAVPRQLSATPEKDQNSSHVFTLEKILAGLAPVKLAGLRGVLDKCRKKTKEFYKEMNRQASMTDEEIREEMAHRAYVRRVLRERRQKMWEAQTVPRRSGRK